MQTPRIKISVPEAHGFSYSCSLLSTAYDNEVIGRFVILMGLDPVELIFVQISL